MIHSELITFYLIDLILYVLLTIGNVISPIDNEIVLIRMCYDNANSIFNLILKKSPGMNNVQSLWVQQTFYMEVNL